MQINENENVSLIVHKLQVKNWAYEFKFLKYFQKVWFNKNQNW